MKAENLLIYASVRGDTICRGLGIVMEWMEILKSVWTH